LKTLNVEGYIVRNDDKWMYDLFGVSSITPNDLRNFLTDANGDEIELRIDCFGGDVWVASDMYSDLRDYKGKSTSNTIGLSASASTVLMLGCDKVIASPTAQFMMHNVQTGTQGDYRDMEQAATFLKNANETVVNAYEIKTGMDRSKLAGIMDSTTWMTAQQAKSHGFIDEISLKEGESLSDLQISAVMSMSSRAYAVASIDTMKMHEYAMKFKGDPEKPAELLNENRGESEPVSDKPKEEPEKPDLSAQTAGFNKLKLKLLGGF